MFSVEDPAIVSRSLHILSGLRIGPERLEISLSLMHVFVLILVLGVLDTCLCPTLLIDKKWDKW